MNKRKKKKQLWLQWIGGSYQLYKQRERQHHEEHLNFQRKGRAGHLTEDDIKNYWITANMPMEIVEKMCKWRKPLRGNKTAFKKISKALAYSHLKR